MEPSKPAKLDGNDTTILSHHPYILCHFVNYLCLMWYISFCCRRGQLIHVLLLWMAMLLSKLKKIICAYHGHTLLLHTGGQESIQSHTSRKYLCNSEWGKWPHPPLITARLDVLAPPSRYFLPLEPVCFCWARPHILWGDCYLLVSCLEL